MSELPHRYPFVLVDRVVASEPDCWIQAEKLVSMGDSLVSSEGNLSPLLLIEAIAQAGALLYSRQYGMPQLLGVDKATFPNLAKAGDRVRLYAETLWLRHSQGLGKARGSAHREDGLLLCQMEFTFALARKE